MNYRKIGIAFCKGLHKEARVVAGLFRSQGFEVVSVICKTGGTSKEAAGIPEECKIHPGQFEAMCNPIGQASLLNEQKTEFNVAIGLCVGHDSLFYRYSDAPVTTLVAKDRCWRTIPAGRFTARTGTLRNGWGRRYFNTPGGGKSKGSGGEPSELMVYSADGSGLPSICPFSM